MYCEKRRNTEDGYTLVAFDYLLYNLIHGPSPFNLSKTPGFKRHEAAFDGVRTP
jgi:hypothetical protein